MKRANVPAEPAGTRYYHGTSALGAISISIDGFRQLHDGLRVWGHGAIGDGIYVTTSLETAGYFTGISPLTACRDTHPYVLEVRLSPGTRILRLDGRYDPRVITYLRREFGKQLLSPKFHLAIPSNKHLTGVELINLANYLWVCGERGMRGGIAAWAGHSDQGPLRRCLQQQHFEGMGCPESDVGIVVFNPSRLLAAGIFQLVECEGAGHTGSARHQLDEPDPSHLAADAAASISAAIAHIPWLRQEIAESVASRQTGMARYDRDKLDATLSELGRWRSCLRGFCARHGISTEIPAITEALAAVAEDGPPALPNRRSARAKWAGRATTGERA
jgi:hypothetical protein